MLVYQKIKIILFEAEMLVGIRKQISIFGKKNLSCSLYRTSQFLCTVWKASLSFHEIQAASENMHHLI